VRQVRLIVNPAAGGGRAAKVLPAVEAALRRSRLEVRTSPTRSLEHAVELAREAAAGGEVVAVLSGDGCVGAVAGALRDAPGAVMAVLPGGRGNDFARVAGIPRDPVAAAALVGTGVPTPIDLGEVDGRPFIGIASLGFDSDANRIANAAPSRLGPFVYAYGALRALLSWRPARFHVEVDGEQLDVEGWSVAAANSGAYGGGMLLAPGADLHDGRLDVVLSTRTSKLTFLRTLPSVFRGTHVRKPFIRVLRGAEVRVSADRPFVVYADGDPIAELPVTIRAVPGAVQVLLPA
jgi:YegS/Rv2252/BmrU family lipid kinase